MVTWVFLWAKGLFVLDIFSTVLGFILFVWLLCCFFFLCWLGGGLGMFGVFFFESAGSVGGEVFCCCCFLRFLGRDDGMGIGILAYPACFQLLFVARRPQTVAQWS